MTSDAFKATMASVVGTVTAAMTIATALAGMWMAAVAGTIVTIFAGTLLIHALKRDHLSEAAEYRWLARETAIGALLFFVMGADVFSWSPLAGVVVIFIGLGHVSVSWGCHVRADRLDATSAAFGGTA